MQENKVISRLPKHLLALIVDQPYEEYTWQDHAVWRFVMRQNLDFLKDKAHHTYLEGLSKTGISIEKIPDIDEMNKILSRIGWAAVTVDGFIPPAAFMEFQAYNVLVIAADIRPIDQIGYTPAPDIIHEAAGHAPIIADPDYAEYLRYFGEVGSKAFSSSTDYELYEAIRHLSILKADPNTAAHDIEHAEQILSEKEANIGLPSEMALIRNLHWWTVEYGLIGELSNPKIYGAGLLSSIGESANAMSDSVKKIPYTIDAAYYNFDITKEQPQLFVTPDFAHLTAVLDEFASQMALRKGGIEGVLKAIESENTATCVYSSGLQVSGTFTDFILHQNQLIYLHVKGPATLNYKDKVLEGHGKDYHADGFGSPVGRIKNMNKPPRYMEDSDLKLLGLEQGKSGILEFESGLLVNGMLKSVIRKEGNLLLLSFIDCTVTYQDKVLFEPAWGVYDMAVGDNIVSVYSGPADANAFGLEFPVPAEKTHKIAYSPQMLELHKLYKQLRDIREQQQSFERVMDLWHVLQQDYPAEWLLPLEMAEYVAKNELNLPLLNEITNHLSILKTSHPALGKLIDRGIRLIKT
jgi:phenylalanine-4-hydroxylase